MRSRSPAAGIAALVLPWVLLAFGAAASAAPLTVCSEGSPDGFDIQQWESAVTHDAVGNTIYDQLILYKRGTTELKPGLAERWEVSPDGLQFTVHLRRGVRFHTTPWFTPTREFNADDVLFSMRRMADPKSPWLATATQGFVVYTGSGMASAVKSVEKLDPMTVRFHLTRPTAPFNYYLAYSFTGSVLSAEYGEKLLKAGTPGKINSEPVGTGPFAFRSYQKDAVIRYAAHAGYWGGKPAVDPLIFAVTPDANVRVQRLKAGECLVGANVKGEAYASFEGTPVKMVGGSTLLTGYIALNTQKKFLSDQRFREALALALDQTTYVKSVYGGRATPAGSFMPPSQWGHDPSLKPRFDPEKAKALVKAAGYDGTELEIMTRIGGSIDGRRAAELMQADWARIGVKTRVRMTEWGELLKVSGRGQHDITFLNWAGGGDPDDSLAPNLSCEALQAQGNKSRWCSKPFDALLDAGRKALDQTQRIAIYKQAQRMIYDEVPLIPTVYPNYFTAVNQRVHGFVASPTSDIDFRDVSVGP